MLQKVRTSFSRKFKRRVKGAALASKSSPVTVHESTPHTAGRESLNPRLCQACQIWNNAKDAFMSMYSFDSIFVPLEELLSRKNCLLCRLISSTIVEKIQDIQSGIIELSKITACIGTPFLIDQVGETVNIEDRLRSASEKGEPLRCVVYLSIRGCPDVPEPLHEAKGRYWPQPSVGVQLLLHYKKNLEHLMQAELWDAPLFDTELVKGWISDCESQHAATCCDMTESPPAGFRLIDTDRLCIVEGPRSARFVALSYVWSTSTGGVDVQLTKSNLERLEQPQSLDIETLPDVISDTLKLCTCLGERYLWIDRLCIIQDDAKSKHSQIRAMDRIYGIATYTIVAAGSTRQVRGLPGVEGRPRSPFWHNHTRLLDAELCTVDMNFHETVDQSVWDTRGWTFQERGLSQRCLYITDFQVYFSCYEYLYQEELSRLPQRNHRIRPSSGQLTAHGIRKAQFKFDLGELGRVYEDGLSTYLACVTQYTSRSLSYQSDVLNAFAGVSSVLAARLGTQFHFGLPEKALVSAMLWRSADFHVRSQDVPEIPSWSWAAWEGRIKFHDYNDPVDVYNRRIGTLTRVYIQARQELRQLNVEEEWFGQHINLDEAFRMEEIRWNKWLPSASDSTSTWLDCPQNPWEAAKYITLDPECYSIASNHPGALVFTTTTALPQLREGKAEIKNDDGRITYYEVCAEESKIGHITLDRQYVNGRLDELRQHRFVVICAGVLPKSESRDLYLSQWWDKRDLEVTPWRLYVMLVEKHDGISKRVGIGSVAAHLWSHAKPRWETIVLV